MAEIDGANRYAPPVLKMNRRSVVTVAGGRSVAR